MTINNGMSCGKCETAIVMAAYNEEKVVASVAEELVRRFPSSAVVVVDDGSKDGTYEVLRALPIHLLRHPINLGQGAALQTGIDYAVGLGCIFLVTFDADGQHNPEDAMKMFEILRTGNVDVVLGSRFLDPQGIKTMDRGRRLLLKAATLFTRMTTGLPFTDTHNGLRAFTVDAASRLDIHMNGMAHASEILENIAKHKLRWTELPIVVRYTEYSKAKGQRASNMFNILWDLFLKGR